MKNNIYDEIKNCSQFAKCLLAIITVALILQQSAMSASVAQNRNSDYSTLAYWKSVDTHSSVTSVAFSPDQSMLAGGLNGKIQIYNEKMELLRELTASNNKKPTSNDSPLEIVPTRDRWMLALAFSPDSKLIAGACYDGTVRIWNIKTDVETICIDPNLANDEWISRSHKSPVRSIAFSHDGSEIVSGSDDKSVKLWDVKSGKLLWDAEGHVFRVVAVAFSADGSSISSFGSKDRAERGSERNATGEFKSWDARTGQLKQSVTADGCSPNGAGISPDGTVAISADGGTNKTDFWDFKTGVCVYTVKFPPGGAKVVGFSPDSSIVTIGTLAGYSPSVSSSNISVIAVRGANPLIHRSLPHPEYGNYNSVSFITFSLGVTGIAMSKDNRSIAFGCVDKTIQIWTLP